MYKLLLLSLTASVAIASDTPLMLFSRQTIPIPCSDQGKKSCGSGCIDTTWTCCPDLRGGCPPTEYCILGTNAQYGCCRNGENCSGLGGASTSHTITSDTVTLASGSASASTSTSATTSASTQKPASSSTSTKTFVSTSGPSLTSASSSTTPSVYTSAKSSVVVLPTTTSNNSATTSSFAAFTGGAGESYGAASPFHALGAVFAALFML